MDVILPPPAFKGNISLEESIKERRSVRRFQNQPISLSDVGQLLWAAQGITHEQKLRAAPSAHALYPLEVYLVVENVTGLMPGVYKYNVLKHELEKRPEGAFGVQLSAATYSQTWVGQSPASIVICAVYDEKGAHAYTLMEVGCVAENVALQAVSLRLGTTFVGAIDPDAVREVLGALPEEQPLCVLPLGKPDTL